MKVEGLMNTYRFDPVEDATNHVSEVRKWPNLATREEPTPNKLV